MTDLTDRLDAIQKRAERAEIPASPMVERLRDRKSQADVPFLLDLARKQQTAIDAVTELANEWTAVGQGPTQFDSALRVCSYKTREAIREALEAKP
jgi:hypothetical protein